MKSYVFKKWFYGSFAVGMISFLLTMPVLVVSQSMKALYVLLSVAGLSMVVSVVTMIIAACTNNEVEINEHEINEG